MARRPRLGPSDNASLALDVTLDKGSLAKLRLLANASRLEAAKALTFTAERAVPAWRAGHGIFHRRNGWIDKGVRMRAATPGDLNAKVGTVDSYMQRHVEGLGETKRGKAPLTLSRVSGRLKANGGIFTPVYGNVSEVPKHTKVRSRLRGFKRTKRAPFIIELNGGDALIARRAGKARLPLQILGRLQDTTRTEPTLDALGIVSGVVSREFGPIYSRLLLAWASKV